MKIKVYIQKINPDLKFPKVLDKADWVDLYASQTIKFKAPQSGTLKSRTVNGQEEKYRNVTFDGKLIPLGVSILAPDGFECQLVARSSTAFGMGIVQANCLGIIDGGPYGYNSAKDEWKFPAWAMRDTTITAGERICQFRIVPSQKATFWQKLKWLFSNGIELVEVAELPTKEARGGFGTTGKY